MSGTLDPYDVPLNWTERKWVEWQPFLLGRGYQLRPRYNPNWDPSWLHVETEPGQQRVHAIVYEDGLEVGGFILDAIRVVDGQKVVFKKVKTNTDEIGIALYLSSQENRTDPRNCSVPILDVIMLPGTDDEALLVMPQLLHFHLLPFRFLGEFCEFALQMLEGLEFMHEHNIAHRDACWYNLMMDTTKVIPKGHHFARWTSHSGVLREKFVWNTRWSVRPVQYHIIDFDMSTRCTSNDSLVLGALGQDKSVPELSEEHMYNPFKVDVYHIGNVLKRCIQDYTGLEVFRDLADSMTRENPKDRPTMPQSVVMCKALIEKITKSRKLKARVWRLKSKLNIGLTGKQKVKVMFGWNPIH